MAHKFKGKALSRQRNGATQWFAAVGSNAGRWISRFETLCIADYSDPIQLIYSQFDLAPDETMKVHEVYLELAYTGNMEVVSTFEEV